MNKITMKEVMKESTKKVTRQCMGDVAILSSVTGVSELLKARGVSKEEAEKYAGWIVKDFRIFSGVSLKARILSRLNDLSGLDKVDLGKLVNQIMNEL